MVVLNGMSRYQLAGEALRRSPRPLAQTTTLVDELQGAIQRAVAYSREHLEDLPEVRDWTWG